MDLFMQALLPVPITFSEERKVFLKEENAGLYTLPQYFLSRNLIELPYTIIVPMIYLLINYWMVGLANTAEQFFTLYFIIVVMSFSAASLGLFIGCYYDDPKLMSSVLPNFTMPLLLFAGFFKNYQSIPVWISWMRFLSPFSYNFTAMVKNETLYKESLIDELNF